MNTLAPFFPHAVMILLGIAAAAAVTVACAAWRERNVHAPDQPGLTVALLLREDDTIRTDDGDLFVTGRRFTGDGYVQVEAAEPVPGGRTYRYEWRTAERVLVLARAATNLTPRNA